MLNFRPSEFLLAPFLFFFFSGGGRGGGCAYKISLLAQFAQGVMFLLANSIFKKSIYYCILETISGFNIQIINSLKFNLEGYASLGLTVKRKQNIYIF